MKINRQTYDPFSYTPLKIGYSVVSLLSNFIAEDDESYLTISKQLQNRDLQIFYILAEFRDVRMGFAYD